MSRSFKKSPFAAFTTAKSEKKDKAINNRRFRRAVRLAIHSEEETLPIEHEHSDPWSMDKDGKFRMSPDAPYYEKAMRK